MEPVEFTPVKQKKILKPKSAVGAMDATLLAQTAQTAQTALASPAATFFKKSSSTEKPTCIEVDMS